MRHLISAALVVVAIGAAVIGCNSDGVRECTSTIANIKPDSAVIATGDTVTLSLLSVTGSCLPSDTKPPYLRWRLNDFSDTAVVRVDSLTGLVTGVAPGKAHVYVLSASGYLLGNRPVTVSP